MFDSVRPPNCAEARCCLPGDHRGQHMRPKVEWERWGPPETRLVLLETLADICREHRATLISPVLEALTMVDFGVITLSQR